MTASRPPNIVLILPDQLRADFVGCYGAGFARTPVMDRLAREGIRYTNAISPHPLCIPGRASLLTGFNAISTGVMTNGAWLRPDHTACGMPSIAELLRGRGYYTTAIGKMHFIPWDIGEGFCYRRIAEDKRHIFIQDDYADFLAGHGLKKPFGPDEEGYAENLMASIGAVPEEFQIDRWVRDQAVACLQNHAGGGATRPLFMIVGFPGPHDPYNPPASWAREFDAAAMPDGFPATDVSEVFRPGQIELHRKGSAAIDMESFPEAVKRRMRAHYSALTANIDACIGDILLALESTGLGGETVVIVTSDHGDLLGDFNLLGKNNFLEPAIKIPLIVRHPDFPAAGVNDGVNNDLVTLTDLFATIALLAGLEPSGRGDSHPLPGLGDPADGGREFALGAIGPGLMITDGTYKLCKYANGLHTLHNTASDPMEQNNLAARSGQRRVWDRLDAVLTAELMRALSWGNLEKTYEYATMMPTHPSHERAWRRPYPVATPQKSEISPHARAPEPGRREPC